MFVLAPTDDHLVCGLNTAQVDDAAVIHDARVLLPAVFDDGAKRRRFSIRQAQYRHGFFTGNHIQRAVANGTFGQGELGNGLSGLDVCGQVFQVDAGVCPVITADVGDHRFAERIGARRSAITANGHVGDAKGVHHQPRAAYTAAAVQGRAVSGDGRAAPG